LTHATSRRGRAAIVALLFFVLAVVLASCGGGTVGSGGPTNEGVPSAQAGPKTSVEGKTSGGTAPGKANESASRSKHKKQEGGESRKDGARSEGAVGGKTVAELPEGVPKYQDWYKDSGSKPIKIRSAGSAGTIPAVEPFNFGRDPGGPEDKTLYLTVPRLGLDGVPVYNSTSEEDLTRSAVHVPATGFPWQDGANVFIAGHRIGYEGTGSYHIFYDIDRMKKGDEITLTDANGEVYRYRMTSLKIVDLDNVEVMNPVKGKDIVSLQTCTLPDYKHRVIVQGERVEDGARNS
jgi:sortase A